VWRCFLVQEISWKLKNLAEGDYIYLPVRGL